MITTFFLLASVYTVGGFVLTVRENHQRQARLRSLTNDVKLSSVAVIH